MSKKNQFVNRLWFAVSDDMKWSQSKTRKSRREISAKTRSDRRGFIKRFVDDIYKAGYKPEKPKKIQKKHLDAVFREWESKGICLKTMQTYLSNMRMVLRALDRDDLLGYVDDYYRERSTEYENMEHGNRSWSSQGVSITDIMEKIFSKDSLVMLQLTLQHRFGLRVRESFRLQPEESIEPNKLRIVRGAKGGRPRVIPVESELDRKLLQHVRKVARVLGGSMMPKQYSENSWRNYYYHILTECGLTKKKLGITSHGLRHEFAQKVYQESSGLVPPVESCTAYRDGSSGESDVLGRSTVAEILGHGRYDITRHYLDQIDSIGTLRNVSTRRPRGHGLRQLNKNGWINKLNEYGQTNAML